MWLGVHNLPDWFFFWPQRVFPTSIIHHTEGQSHYHLYETALLLAVPFWIGLSGLLMYVTRNLSYRKFVWIFPISIFATELIVTHGLRLVGFSQFLDGP